MLRAGLDARVAIVAEVQIAEEIDGQDAHRLLRRLEHPFDVDHRREADAFVPERPQAEQHALIERPGVADDLIVRAAGDGVDRLAKRPQRTLIRELDGHDHRHADGDAEDGQRGAGLLAEERAEDERFQN